MAFTVDLQIFQIYIFAEENILCAYFFEIFRWGRFCLLKTTLAVILHMKNNSVFFVLSLQIHYSISNSSRVIYC